MSIFFCTPCYGGMAVAHHMLSGLALKEGLEAANIDHEWDIGTTESLVHRARMQMTASFLDRDWQAMMWVDADISYSPDDVAKLWNLNVPIAVAAYAMKRPDMPLSAWKNGKLVTIEEFGPDPDEVDYAGTGFMMIRRTAIERVAEYLVERENEAQALMAHMVSRLGAQITPRQRYLVKAMLSGVAASYEGPGGRRVPALYMTPIWNDGLESEDYSFCRLAREAGFKIIMDPSIRLGHWGLSRYG